MDCILKVYKKEQPKHFIKVDGLSAIKQT